MADVKYSNDWIYGIDIILASGVGAGVYIYALKFRKAYYKRLCGVRNREIQNSRNFREIVYIYGAHLDKRGGKVYLYIAKGFYRRGGFRYQFYYKAAAVV